MKINITIDIPNTETLDVLVADIVNNYNIVGKDTKKSQWETIPTDGLGSDLEQAIRLTLAHLFLEGPMLNAIKIKKNHSAESTYGVVAEAINLGYFCPEGSSLLNQWV
jgi:hypothetical protein